MKKYLKSLISYEVGMLITVTFVIWTALIMMIYMSAACYQTVKKMITEEREIHCINQN